MMAGLQAYNGMFLADLSNLESRISTVNNQISSGIRVNQASDDPAAVAPIIAYQSEIASINQVQTNLSTTQTEAQTADGALESASTLLDQLVTLGANGASSTATAADRQTFGQQVQDVEQQLVALANTSVNGQYIFGGDNPTVAPYTYNWGATSGATANVATPSSTASISDSNGNQIVPRLTAQSIFDLQVSPGGGPAAGNIFQAAFDLGQALLSNNLTGATSTSLATVTNPATSNIDPSSSFTLTVNGTNYSIPGPISTLNGLATAINGSGAGVTASAVNVGTAAAPDYRLNLQSPNGAPDSIKLSDANNVSLLSTISAGIDEVKAGATQLSQATTSYGDIQTWIQQATSSATSKLNDIQAALSSIRDADVATDATQLTLDQTAMQASLAAHGNMNTKSLFDYLG